ncbi:MAG: PASTA domain-containing protein [Bacteroidales bacterium OttesenSCG-928-I14]|jgi:cell division protein FtsI (penicillin-binding protein 3)|nr:PASTA domain-containing protein [Bacteroidales bacterium OttesenSCG-928-I14]
MDENQSIDKRIKDCYAFLVFVVIIFFVFIFGKACVISIFYGKYFGNIGNKQFISTNLKIFPKRGDIYSSEHELMATSKSEYRLFVDFLAEGIKVDTLKKYVGTISVELNKMFPGKSADQYRIHIMKGWNIRYKKNRRYRLLDQDVSYLQMEKIKRMPFFNKGSNKSGLYCKLFLKRVNPYGTLALRTIGDVYGELGKGGKNGLEKYYDNFLCGRYGSIMRKKIHGKCVDIYNSIPISGRDIVTTINVKIQDIVEKNLLDNLKKFKAEFGSVVLMEVATGEVKAIANLKYIGKNTWKEVQNYAVSDLGEPGSTFKVVSMMVAIEDGLVRAEDSVDTDDGKVMICGKLLTDHNANRGGYGKITASQSIRYSSNIGVARLIQKAYGNNPGKYVDGIYRIGFCKDMKLEIPGAGIPKIRHPKIKKSKEYWSNSTLPWMSFGYETQIPPIYILSFFNAIANNGKLIKPIFVKKIVCKKKILYKKTQVINNKICSTSTLVIIRKMLDDVVNKLDGTGASAHSDNVSISGKTGTIRISKGAEGYNSYGISHQVSFCGYFPSERPQYSCIVVMWKPHCGIPSGGNMCGPVFKNIAEEMYAKKFVSNIESISLDTIHPFLPFLKNGRKGCIVQILKRLQIPNVNINNKGYDKLSICTIKNNSMVVFLKNQNGIFTKVPDVRGMGAKDAVFTLESVGFKVNLFGRGTVSTQSILPGISNKKNKIISLYLK